MMMSRIASVHPVWSIRQAALLTLFFLCLLAANSALGADAPLFGPRQVINPHANSPVCVHAADLDGDGDVDVLSATEDGIIAWYENNGARRPQFTIHVISSTVTNAYSVFAADLNGDKKLDVLAVSMMDGKVLWFENDGQAAPTFTEHLIFDTYDLLRSATAADLDGDGDNDVVVVNETGKRVLWFENSGGASPVFTPHVIPEGVDGLWQVKTVDLDHDGDIDILVAAWDSRPVYWFENSGGPNPTFTRRMAIDFADRTQGIAAADMDGDGDQDVLINTYDHVAWCENNGATPPVFTRHDMAESGAFGGNVEAADLDSDGDQDILAANLILQRVEWYANDGKADPAFVQHSIDEQPSSVAGLFPADLDGDGDLDVIAGMRFGNLIVWFENLTPHNAVDPGHWTIYE